MFGPHGMKPTELPFGICDFHVDVLLHDLAAADS